MSFGWQWSGCCFHSMKRVSPELGPFGPLVTPLLGGVLPIVEAEVIELGMDVVA